MKRKAFLLNIHSGRGQEYALRHQAIWSEMADLLTKQGARNYSIFYDDKTEQLFGYVEIEDEERWLAIAQDPICRRWWRYMSDIMITNPDGSPVTREITEVFHLA